MIKKISCWMMALAITVSVLAGCTTQTVQSDSSSEADTPSHSLAQESQSEAQQQQEIREETADVVIVGAGGGGMSAALQAVADGAESVILVEKLSKTGGALNSTSGTMSGAMTVIQELDGLNEDSLELYKADILKEGSKDGGKPNETLVDVYVNQAKTAINWLWDNGMKDYEFVMDEKGHKAVFAPEHTLYSYPRSYKIKAKDSSQYQSGAHEILDGLIAKEPKIQVYLHTFAQELKPNAQGQILVVDALDTSNGQPIRFTATKGIIMATGGYAANPDLMRHFDPDMNGVITGGMPTSDGYGIRMMQEVGGQIHTDAMSWVPTYTMGLENPELPGTGRIMSTKTQYAGGIYVNKNGERFVDETHMDAVVREHAQTKQPEGIQFEVYTDKIVEDLLQTSQAGMYKGFFMSDNRAKYILKDSTLEELAEQMGVPADALAKTVSQYNAVVEQGGTDTFGRVCAPNDNPYNLAQNKIEGSQYYAVAIKPLALLTMGGIQTNTKMQVLDTQGNVIPGLYAVGEVVGGVWGRYISSGCGVMGPISFGQVAAQSIMTEPLEAGYTPAPAQDILDMQFFHANENAETADRFDMSASLQDGEYTATVSGQEGPLTIVTTIKEGKISKIDIVEQNETPAIGGKVLEDLPKTIIEQNSVNVDAVAGATLSSHRVLDAVALCLKQAAA